MNKRVQYSCNICARGTTKNECAECGRVTCDDPECLQFIRIINEERLCELHYEECWCHTNCYRLYHKECESGGCNLPVCSTNSGRVCIHHGDSCCMCNKRVFIGEFRDALYKKGTICASCMLATSIAIHHLRTVGKFPKDLIGMILMIAYF